MVSLVRLWTVYKVSSGLSDPLIHIFSTTASFLFLPRFSVPFTSSFPTSLLSKYLSLPSFSWFSTGFCIPAPPPLLPVFPPALLFPTWGQQFAGGGGGGVDRQLTCPFVVERNQSPYQTGSHHQLPGRPVLLCSGCHLQGFLQPAERRCRGAGVSARR